MKIGLLGFGEVGQTLAGDLQSVPGVELAAYDIQFDDSRSAPSLAVSRYGSVAAAQSAAGLAANAELVISAVTAAQDLAATRSIAPGLVSTAFVLDLNSVSPVTKRECAKIIGDAGGRYVEAAVMSPIAPKRIASPMLLGGAHAGTFLPIAAALGFSGARVVSEEVGRASATKMCRSVIVKGLEALVLESLLAARRHGVEEKVLESLRDLHIEDWGDSARYMASRALLHGRRRAEEMREVSHTVRDAGLTPHMSEACATWQEWAGAHSQVDAPDLPHLLDALLADVPRKGAS